MTRFTPPDVAALSPEQRAVYDATRAGRRGTVPANVLAWLPSPELAGRAAHLGEFVRYGTSLPPALSELAILVVARHWSCQYEWAIHAGEAARAGVSAAVIAAIADRRRPALDDTAAVIADVAGVLVSTGTLPAATFAAGEAALGRRGLVELVGLVGYYTMVALTLNAFDVPVPDGAPRLP
jgi:4-carboxymuconolactone decarboxylase